MGKSGARWMAILVRILLILAGLGVLVPSIFSVAGPPWVSVVVFVAVGALAKLVEVDSTRYGRVSFDGYVAISAALLFPLRLAIVIYALYSVLAALMRQERVTLGGPLYILATKSLVLYGAGITLLGMPLLAGPSAVDSVVSWRLVQVLAFTAVFYLLENGVEQVEEWAERSTAVLPAVADRFRSLYQLYLGTMSVGVLVALMYSSMGPYALIIFSVPMAIIRYSFGLIVSIQRTYKDTIRALVRAMEVEDPTSSSHSERVAELATDIASELGMVGDQLESINYGALLHDIGRLGVDYRRVDTLVDDGKAEAQPMPHAVVGADILEQVPFLRRYSSIVAHHHDPYPGAARSGADVERLQARVVAVANCYDRLVTGLEGTTYSPSEAVSYMKSEVANFDPQVLRALASVLQRRGRLVLTGYAAWGQR